MKDNKIKDLPNSDDEFWNESDKHINKLKQINVCDHNTDNWKSFKNYVTVRKGIMCRICGWGTMLPGYYRVSNGRVVDLRGLNRN